MDLTYKEVYLIIYLSIFLLNIKYIKEAENTGLKVTLVALIFLPASYLISYFLPEQRIIIAGFLISRLVAPLLFTGILVKKQYTYKKPDFALMSLVGFYFILQVGFDLMEWSGSDYVQLGSVAVLPVALYLTFKDTEENYLEDELKVINLFVAYLILNIVRYFDIF